MKRQTERKTRASAQPAPEPETYARDIDADIEAYRKVLEAQAELLRKRYPGIRLAGELTEEEEKEHRRKATQRLRKAGERFNDLFKSGPNEEIGEGHVKPE